MRSALGPPPPVREIAQRSILFPTRLPIRLTHPYRLVSDVVVPDRDIDAIQILTSRDLP
jgi:hypothetical protein